jgi:hypothetical protein
LTLMQSSLVRPLLSSDAYGASNGFFFVTPGCRVA